VRVPEGGGPVPPSGAGVAAAAPPTETDQRQVINSGSYGAAFFNWIYLVAMRAWGHAVLAFILDAVFWPAAWVIYGIYGKRIAWQSRRWRDFNDFVACQRVWTQWAVWITVILAVVMVLGILAAVLTPLMIRPRHPSV